VKTANVVRHVNSLLDAGRVAPAHQRVSAIYLEVLQR
jgi:hypothetical protein